MVNILRGLDFFIGRVLSRLLRLSPSSSRKEGLVDIDTAKKILLVKLWGLGNLSIIWPLINKIKRRYPHANIYFLTFDLNRGFLERNKDLYEIIYFSFSINIVKIIKEVFRLFVLLRGEHFDVVINFETFNAASALFSYYIKAPVRIGINNGFEKAWYSWSVDNNKTKHISELFSELLWGLQINSSYSYFSFSGATQEKRKVNEILKGRNISSFICIHPGTSFNFKGKRWAADKFAVLSDMLVDKHDFPVFIVGMEKELAARILGIASNKERIFDLTGMLNIWELIELLKKSSLFISNDTGPVHLASSLGINTVVLYGPSSPLRYRPLNPNSLIFYSNLTCSPCIGSGYINRACKSKFECLNFSVEEVFEKISEKYFH